MQGSAYFVSLHHKIGLDVNIPALAELTPQRRELIRGAAGVLLPRYFSPSRCREVASLARNVFPRIEARYHYRGKTEQIRLMRRLGLPHPESRLFESPAEAKRHAEEHGPALGLPCVLKGDRGAGGSEVFPVRSQWQLLDRLKRLPQNEPVLLQDWVETGGRDLRVVVVGDEMRSYFRVGVDGFYNNLARGARIEQEARPDLQQRGRELARHAAAAAGIDLAGFDIAFPEESKPVLLEINFLFGTKGLGGKAGYNRLFGLALARWMRRVLDQPGVPG
jgi:ribosomal protein S6--L-glutamate ligase